MILVLVVDMVVAAVPIIVPSVTAVMVVVGLHGRDRGQQASAQQECTQVTFHLVVTLLHVRRIQN
jgi:hypothetical protein